ncbi:hypothetical protein HPG69_008435, partial [Diceros bicornis minor]
CPTATSGCSSRFLTNSKFVGVTKLAIYAAFCHIDSSHLYNNDNESGWAIRSKLKMALGLPTLPIHILQVPKSKAAEATTVNIDVGFCHIDVTCLRQNEEEICQALQEKMERDTMKTQHRVHTNKHLKVFQQALGKGPNLKNKYNINVVLGIPSKDFSSLPITGSCVVIPFGLGNSQVECQPYLNQSNLMEFCKCKDIVVVAHSALGSQRDPNYNENIRMNLCQQLY